MKKYVFSKEKCLESLKGNLFMDEEDLRIGMIWMTMIDGEEVDFSNEDSDTGRAGAFRVSKQWCVEV